MRFECLLFTVTMFRFCPHLGDNPLADTFLAGAGDDLREGDGDVPGVRDGVRGEGVLFLEPGPPTVRRLVGRLGPGEEEAAGDLDLGVMEVEVAGDLDLVLGEPGTERVVRGEEGRETERGEAGTERWRPEQQSSSRSSDTEHHSSVIDYLNTNESLLAAFEQPFVIVSSLAARTLFSAIHYKDET